MNPEPRRAIPSVDRLLTALAPTPLPRSLVVEHVRQQLARYRSGPPDQIPDFPSIVDQTNRDLAATARSRLQPVINATGILAHTNLGRAPLSGRALQELGPIAGGYSNLEFDLDSGERGRRGGYLEALLALLCESEAATLVNNCAAALVLVLRHLTRGARTEVLVSRGEMVQIGGGFRIPDILEASGARLREVGTTNRTTLSDYSDALTPQTALILKVHRSNFYMEGFVESPSTRDLSSLAREHDVPFLEDLGSGALVDLHDLAGLEAEPQPRAVLQDGADLVCFSGDKLLGGPQCGILAGRRSLIDALKKDPFFRALRCDKLVFAALQTTAETYLAARDPADGVREPRIPMLDLMRVSTDVLLERAASLLTSLGDLPASIDIADATACVGGGVCPRSTLPSPALRIRPRQLSVQTLAGRLREGRPPVIGQIRDDAVLLHLRTVFPEQEAELGQRIREALGPR